MNLEFKHIAPYLPYKLKWVLQEVSEFTMSGITKETLYTEDGGVFHWLKVKDWPQVLFPILRPMSDLIKEIEVNGKKFVPLLELRSIEQGYRDDDVFIQDHTQIIDYGCGEGDYPCYWVEWADGLSQKQSFSFKHNDFNRFWIINKNKLNGIEPCIIKNQRLLFEKLYELHFDVFGLINAGLAKDINKL